MGAGFEPTKEFMEVDDLFFKKFGDYLPSLMLPAWETTAGVIEKAKKCLETGINNLDKIYNLENLDPDISYY